MKSLEKYSRSTLSRLKKLLIAYSDSEDPEVLHDIRVEIKKLKAVLLLLEDSLEGFKAHGHFVPFREIFRQAGAIREPQVAGQLATQYDLKKSIGKTPAIASLIEIFKFDIPVLAERIDRLGKKIVHQASRVKKKEFFKSIKRKAGLVKKNVHPHVLASELHKTRKILKVILYLSDVTDVVSKKERVFYSSLEQRIGKLHDKQNLLKSIGGKKAGKLSVSIATDEAAITELVRKFYRKRKK